MFQTIKLKQYGIAFCSRESYGKREDITLDNAIFYENFAAWIEDRSKSRNLPLLEAGKTALRIDVMSPGYVIQTDLDRGQYRIQLRLVYLEEKGE